MISKKLNVKILATFILGLIRHNVFWLCKIIDIWKISWNNHQNQSVPKLAHCLKTFTMMMPDDWSFISFTKEKRFKYKNFKEVQIFSFPVNCENLKAQ